MKLQVNGEPRDTDAATVRDLIVEMGLGDHVVAVERNGEVVPKREHAEHPLSEGDRLEIVTLVGGG